MQVCKCNVEMVALGLQIAALVCRGRLSFPCSLIFCVKISLGRMPTQVSVLLLVDSGMFISDSSCQVVFDLHGRLARFMTRVSLLLLVFSGIFIPDSLCEVVFEFTLETGTYYDVP